jgi:DNA-directed RNA polymerase subunit RPC12/RpoP
LKFNCIYCGQHMECAPRLAGRQFLCPSCKHRIVIPKLRGVSIIRRALMAAHTWDEFVPLPDIEVPTRYRTRTPGKAVLAGAA